MRTLLAFMFVLLLSVPAFADSPYDVCNTVPAEVKVRCLEKVMDHEFAMLKAQEQHMRQMEAHQQEMAREQAAGQFALGLALGGGPFRQNPIVLPPVPIPPQRPMVAPY